MSTSNELMTTEEAARFLRIHVETLRQMVRDKRLPSMKFGNRWRFCRIELEEYGRQQSSRLTDRDLNEKSKRTK